MMEDKEIINLYFARNEDAIKQTDLKYGGYCGKIAYNILYDYEDAKECVNDTWLNTWNNIPPTKPKKLQSFLAKICRNIALNMYEKYKAIKRNDTETNLVLNEFNEIISKNDVEDYINEQELIKSINNFLKNIDIKNRIVFVQRYFYIYSIKEIAKENNLSESNVKMILMRTRNQLKENLIKDGFHI